LERGNKHGKYGSRNLRRARAGKTRENRQGKGEEKESSKYAAKALQSASPLDVHPLCPESEGTTEGLHE
jgi:hypothetical protein